MTERLLGSYMRASFKHGNAKTVSEGKEEIHVQVYAGGGLCK